MAVLDTNILIRYLTNDNADLSPRALRFLQSVDAGERSVYLPEAVLVETVQVMMSDIYRKGREEVRRRLRPILAISGIEMNHKRSYNLALDIFVDYPRLSIVDSICAAHSDRYSDKAVVTYDRGFRNIPGITREEP
jgi:predicted nucleic acid-binding protein